MYPSEDVIHLCNAAEKIVKSNIESENEADRDAQSMVNKTLKMFIGTDIFHMRIYLNKNLAAIINYIC